MRALFAVLLIGGIAGAEDAPRVYRVEPVGSCQLPTGETVGAGCWMSEVDCMAKAHEQRALRETLTAAEKMLSPVSGGLGWRGAALLIFLGAGAGFAAGVALK